MFLLGSIIAILLLKSRLSKVTSIITHLLYEECIITIMSISIEYFLLTVVILLLAVFYFFSKSNRKNGMPDNEEIKIQDLSKSINENTLTLKELERTSKVLENTTNRSSDTVKEFYTLFTKAGASVGKFGEIALKRILEHAGLKQHIHFDEQKEMVPGFRPDVTIKLPDEKYIVIDSKVSLTDYSEYIKAKDRLNLDNFYKKHRMSVKKHIDDLKKYKEKLDEHSLELIIMFMPVEGAYIAACDEDLISHAIKAKVAIVGPSTLVAILQIISRLWETKKQSENLSKIVKAGVDICNDVKNVNAAFIEMEKALTKANASITTGKMRTEKLVNKAEKMRKMGIPADNITD